MCSSLLVQSDLVMSTISCMRISEQLVLAMTVAQALAGGKKAAKSAGLLVDRIFWLPLLWL